MLFAADRAHHLSTEIEPALKKSKNVISDRYVLSNITYGSVDIPQALLMQLNANFRKPHVTFIIDTQPAVCLDRIKKSRHHVELFEDEQRMQALRKIFLSLKKLFPETYVVDGNRAPEEVFKDIQKVIAKLP
jgi:dTMP kinase